LTRAWKRENLGTVVTLAVFKPTDDQLSAKGNPTADQKFCRYLSSRPGI
jgi:hypothetical protein